MTARRDRLIKIGAATLILIAGSAYLGVTTVTIRNESPVPLTDMKCAVNGRALCPRSVAPGETRRAYAVLEGEDAMVFSFRMKGNDEQAIIGYPIPMPARSYGITVAPDMTISQEFNYRW